MNSLERTRKRLLGETPDRIPAHPLFMTYAARRIGVLYSDYVRDYRILARGQLALLERFDTLDVVSCCSDAWREAADCGAELAWHDHLPPTCRRPVLDGPETLARLRMPDPEGGGRMSDRLEAVRLFASRVKGHTPILGWVEGPLAEAVNLLGMDALLVATLEQPEFVAALMDWTTELATRFAKAQVAAGADIIGLGDAAASLVSPEYYAAEVAPRERAVIGAIHEAGAFARLHICGNVHGKFAAMDSTGADLIDIDYPQTLAEARRGGIRPAVCLCGNLHPVAQLRDAAPERVAADLAEAHRQAGEAFILAPGCEVPPDTPDAPLRAFFASAYAHGAR